jgi:hypothetical protein
MAIAHLWSGSPRHNRLFDTDAQVRPRGKPRFYSLFAGQRQR